MYNLGMDYNEGKVEVLKLVLEALKDGTSDGLSHRDISQRTGFPEMDVITIIVRAFAEMDDKGTELTVSGKGIDYSAKVDDVMIGKLEDMLRGLDSGDNIPDWS